MNYIRTRGPSASVKPYPDRTNHVRMVTQYHTAQQRVGNAAKGRDPSHDDTSLTEASNWVNHTA
jgi:hypothetical protein